MKVGSVAVKGQSESWKSLACHARRVAFVQWAAPGLEQGRQAPGLEPQSALGWSPPGVSHHCSGPCRPAACFYR